MTVNKTEDIDTSDKTDYTHIKLLSIELTNNFSFIHSAVNRSLDNNINHEKDILLKKQDPRKAISNASNKFNESKPENEKRSSIASKSDSPISTNVKMKNSLKTQSNSIESKSISISNIGIKKAKQLLIKDLPIQTTFQSQLHQ